MRGRRTPQLVEVEQALKAYVLARARDLADESPARVERDSRAARARAALTRLQGERDQALNELGELAAAKARRVMSDRAYAAAAGPIEKTLDWLEAQILQLDVAEQHAARPLAEVASAAVRVAELWDAMTPAEQRAEVRVVVERVLIRRAGYRGEPVGERLLPPSEGVTS